MVGIIADVFRAYKAAVGSTLRDDEEARPRKMQVRERCTPEKSARPEKMHVGNRCT